MHQTPYNNDLLPPDDRWWCFSTNFSARAHTHTHTNAHMHEQIFNIFCLCHIFFLYVNMINSLRQREEAPSPFLETIHAIRIIFLTTQKYGGNQIHPISPFSFQIFTPWCVYGLKGKITPTRSVRHNNIFLAEPFWISGTWITLIFVRRGNNISFDVWMHVAWLFWLETKGISGIRTPRLHPESWASDIIDNAFVFESNACIIFMWLLGYMNEKEYSKTWWKR